MDLFLQKVVEDGYTSYSITNAGYGLFIALMVAALFVVSYFINKDGKGRMSIKQLTVSALLLALAFVLSNLKLFKAPMGGSVTLFSMFMVTFIGYVYGPRVSLAAAFAYGLLQMIVNPYIISVPQLICDYVLAFTALGLAGFFHDKKYGLFTGYLVGIFGRYVFSVLSGIIFFADYAPESMGPVVYSLVYNIAYIGIEALLTIAVLLVPTVRKALNRIKIEANEKNLKKEVTVA